MRKLLIAISLLISVGLTSPAKGLAVSSTPTKVLIIVEENHIRSAAEAGMPYMVSLQRQYGYGTNAQATSHPSLPNYLMLAFGSTFGITDDNNPVAHPIHVPSVFGQALAHGKTAHVYSDAATTNCPLKNQGTFFKVRHTGWPYATDERAQCGAFDTPIAPLAGDINAGRLPNVGWLIPSIQHDAHNPSTLKDADTWLKQEIPAILAGPDFTSGDLAVVITFDEGKTTNQNVSFVVLHPTLSGRVVTSQITQHDLYEWQQRLAGVTTDGNDAGSVFGL